MGYQKEKYLEAIGREIEVSLQSYKKEKKKSKSELTQEEEKKLSDVIDCQIEDTKIKRDERRERGVLG